jgi:hypothetical protein
VLLLVHTPPATASLTTVLAPAHTLNKFVIGLGGVVAVSTIVILHPVLAEVKVITVDPGPTPFTTPVFGLIVATDVVPLVHVPPPGSESLSVIGVPIQTLFGPVIAGGGVQQ